MVLILLLALALRVLDARGALWVDEAWSVVYASPVAPFTGVFLDINHDNNHHINSLWIQLIGPHGAPMAYRALSIASGVATVGVAALIAGRRSATAALATALLLAVAPFLVIVGSEARGYAPMLLAAIVTVAIADRWIRDPARPLPRAQLAAVAAFGMLSHLTYIVVLPSLAAWTMMSLRTSQGNRRAFDMALSLWLPAVTLSIAAIAAVIAIALARSGVLKVGGYQAYSAALVMTAFGNLAHLTTGLGWAGIIGIVVLAIAGRTGDRLPVICALMAATLPLAVIVLHPGNSGFERYYVLTTLALLLFAGLKIGWLIDKDGVRRWLAIGLLGLFTFGALLEDVRQIANRRGAPEEAVALIARSAPMGALVASQSPADVPVLMLAAASIGYPIKIAPDCRTASYRFVGWTPGPASPQWCGARWRQIAAKQARMPSGASWRLFVRETTCQSPRPLLAARPRRAKQRFDTPERA